MRQNCRDSERQLCLSVLLPGAGLDLLLAWSSHARPWLQQSLHLLRCLSACQSQGRIRTGHTWPVAVVGDRARLLLCSSGGRVCNIVRRGKDGRIVPRSLVCWGTSKSP